MQLQVVALPYMFLRLFKAPSQLMIGLKTSKPLSNLLTQVR